MNVLTIEKISKSYGIKTLFNDLSLSINDEDKIGLIGVNGTGKSTLLKIIQGIETSDKGELAYKKGVRIEALHQTQEFDNQVNILEQVLNDASKVSKDQEIWNLESQAKTVLTKLGIHDFERKIESLSGGQKKRVALATALISPCDLLILDEPTNHMDNDTIDWLEEYLKRRKGALIMITHDRYFLDRVVNKISELDKGRLFEYQGNYTSFIEKKIERMEMEQRAEQKNENLFRRELEWIKRGAKARSTKQKARIQRFDEIKESRGLILDGEVEIDVASARLGNKTIELSNISKSFGELTVIKDYTYTLLKDDRIGIIGDNGIGKSTLLNIIAGILKPDFGTIEVGSTVRVGYFSQESEGMDENLKAIDYIKETAENFVTPKGKYVGASKLMETFLFDSQLQYTVINQLSGGEKRRLFLLKVLIDEPNVLLFDEPTNDLDIETLKILEHYIDIYEGIVITVSHDRYFLDRTCNRMFSFEGEGTIKEYMGNYSDYLVENKSNNQTRILKTTIANNDNTNNEKKSEHKTNKVNLTAKNPKLTFNEKREFDIIEDEIEKLEERLDEIALEIEASTSDYTKLQELNDENELVELKLLEKMERFEYLSDKYELSN